ncbi:MAG: hypothetical protein JNL69_05635 [Bacteroidia bacterium]|nr:hypothetical protein [Bacteroidia bacterium]
MKKLFNVLLLIVIFLNLLTIGFSSSIVYKALWNLSFKPGFTIENKINYVKESTDINELKKTMIEDLEQRKQYIKDKDDYTNAVFFYGIIVLLSTGCCLILSLVLKRNVNKAFS